jgi:hypothetical protein
MYVEIMACYITETIRRDCHRALVPDMELLGPRVRHYIRQARWFGEF